jgi:hypothetical protein
MLIYTVGVLVSGSFWLIVFLVDKETPKKHSASWVVLCLAALLWPVSVPLSCAELLNKAKDESLQKQTMINEL